MVDDFMSTEDSDHDDTFLVHPLKWRSLKVNDFFARLDVTTQSRRSSQSHKMRNQRKTGEPSERPCLVDKYAKSLRWAFTVFSWVSAHLRFSVILWSVCICLTRTNGPSPFFGP